MPVSLIVTFAAACGLSVGSLYYAQPLLRILGSEFGVSEALAGTLVSFTQTGYICGLLLLAPLGDLLENRKLISSVLACGVAAAAMAGSAKSFPAFVVSAFAVGVTAVVAQMLIPLAAHLAPAARRGQIVGQVTSGLLTGILVARGFSGIVSGILGWRAVYFISAGLSALMVLILRMRIPERRPTLDEGYSSLIRSLVGIYKTQPVLQRRALYHAAMFASFTVFWTGITFHLFERWHFSQVQIGLFALAGAAGAMFASVAGRMADRGYSKSATGGAMVLAVAAFLLTLITSHVWLLVAGAVLLDLAVNTNLVIGQYAIYGLDPASRSRINTLYIATWILGGVTGAGFTGLAFSRGGWPAVVALGVSAPIVAFVFWLMEPSKAKAVTGAAETRVVR